METAFLIPIGAATEEIHGISHLFEHLLIRSLLNYRERITGYTTEDYITFLCNGLSSVEFLNLINISIAHLLLFGS